MSEVRYGKNPNSKECCFYVLCDQDKQLEKLKEINSALKLQELVKEKIKECKRNAGGMEYGMALESLVEESEK